ncbi:MAG: DUF2177 family protein [Cereibacter changlensis]|jgi:uncharacterized membrane protein|uniref:DUF2177 family protein n=1 Tax=Cereibacter changlensis TaxID=402884 RepID=UPI00302C3E0D
MSVLILYAATAVTFLALDALMLSFVMKPLFTRHIGALMLESPRFAAAAVFYLAYVAGLVWLVSLPALRDGGNAFVMGAVVGAMAYGTYEFTSYAILRDWHPSMVATDLIWGTLLTGFSAWAGVAVTRALTTA